MLVTVGPSMSSQHFLGPHGEELGLDVVNFSLMHFLQTQLLHVVLVRLVGDLLVALLVLPAGRALIAYIILVTSSPTSHRTRATVNLQTLSRTSSAPAKPTYNFHLSFHLVGLVGSCKLLAGWDLRVCL
jgi:hypothetical protein